ncbi:extracellular solute-binding protein [Dactylosporangium sp. NPDC049525]|uniref:ABC transporter substrate-binding protein n=1 Tax=Dactylosporangium sp. NPDC049525 TaxID=3154730 RepID=UPI00341AD852
MTDLRMSRRSALQGLAGAAALFGAPAFLTACSGDDDKTGDAGSPTDPITFGSNYSDDATKTAFAALTAAATESTKVPITVNTTDHNTFQNNISSYLQGTPDSLATWFAGYRLQFFAAQGLLTPIDDVWEKIGGTFNDAAKSLSKGIDGHYYLVPLYNYPWVVFYNKSVFAAKGYQVPTTWDAFVALCQRMKTDGLVPLAFAEKDGWPALGTFDILNLRINGFEFHTSLMKHEAPWTDPRVLAVFDQWRQIMPYTQNGANGRTWQDAAKALENKQAGMMFQGSNQVAANYAPANLADLDFFPYPVINPAHGQKYMDAPTDGFMLPKKGKNPAAAKAVLQYIGTAAAETKFLETDHWDVGLANGLVAPTYNEIQKKSVAEIAKCQNVSQFMDRDTVPDMATVMIKAIQTFIDAPTMDTASSILKSAEDQAKTIFTK